MKVLCLLLCLGISAAAGFSTHQLDDHHLQVQDHGWNTTDHTFAKKKNTELYISAFNIEVLGVSKMMDTKALDTITKILIRYDLVFIQEVRDSSETVIKELLRQTNLLVPKDPFDVVFSERLGRTAQKEQYVYFFRKSRLSVTQTYQWTDAEGIFERPPFVVRFKVKDLSLEEFGFIGCHVQPSNAKEEIDRLVSVYNSMIKRWKMTDFVIGGDFNAGCRHVCQRCWKDIRLRTDNRFMWVIGDDVDTTIYDSNCPYDRLVLAGLSKKASYVQDSGLVFRFDEEYKLNSDMARDVSDHAPVEMKIK